MTLDEVESMPYCPKCGAEVTEEMDFCSKCGAVLGPSPPRVRREKEEKHEKREKREKSEKREKYEKGEHFNRWIYVGMLIGGLLLILAGVNAYLNIISRWYARYSEPIFLIVIGLIIIFIVIYATMTATKRSPRPP